MIKGFNPLPISEARFQAQVIQIARTFGWRVAHFRPGMDRRGNWKTAVQGDGEGFPDLILVHVKTHDIIFAEIKSDRGALTPDQVKWLEALDGLAIVWRPRDFNLMRARLMAHHTGPRRGDDPPPPPLQTPPTTEGAKA